MTGDYIIGILNLSHQKQLVCCTTQGVIYMKVTNLFAVNASM